MKCTAVFCTNKATTVVRIKHKDGTFSRLIPRCDKCLDEHKRWYDNPERPDVLTGRFAYEPIN